MITRLFVVFFFSSRRRHTRYWRDWSSDVCSSDLLGDLAELRCRRVLPLGQPVDLVVEQNDGEVDVAAQGVDEVVAARKSVGQGKSVDLGGRRIIKKEKIFVALVSCRLTVSAVANV